MRTTSALAGTCLAVGLACALQPAMGQPGGDAQATPGAQRAASAGSIEYLAGNCTTCHGTEGRPVDTQMPELAGLSPNYFIEQIRLFREGKREATIMNQIAKGYTEAEMAALAGYFSSRAPSSGEDRRR